MKKSTIALCLTTLVVSIFISTATPINAAYCESQEEVVSPFYIDDDTTIPAVTFYSLIPIFALRRR